MRKEGMTKEQSKCMEWFGGMKGKMMQLYYNLEHK